MLVWCDFSGLQTVSVEMEAKYREQKEKEAAAEKAREAKASEEAKLKADEEVKVKEEPEADAPKTNGDEKPGEENGDKEEGEMDENSEGPEKGQLDSEKPEASKKMDEESQPDEEETKTVEEEPKVEEKKPENVQTDQKETKKRKRSRSGSSSSSSGSSSGSSSDEEGEKKEDKEKSVDKTQENEVGKKDKEEEDKDDVEIISDDKPEKPKALHKTTSIFLRNLAPTITKQEVEAICNRYEGFLRVALADPQPERRWLRRGWVTFKRDANIKEICWNLNNIRLRDCELGAIVNRDLSRRIRPVNGIVAHKQVVRSDIRIAAKVTLHLDAKAALWVNEDDEQRKRDDKNQAGFGLVSNNPVLHNITDYLIEEASAEEEELLGLEPTAAESQEAVTTVDRDENLIRVLDRIVLYLRIVHSVDYYNHCEYPNEDEMPNRCGILHARGPPPTSKVKFLMNDNKILVRMCRICLLTFLSFSESFLVLKFTLNPLHSVIQQVNLPDSTILLLSVSNCHKNRDVWFHKLDIYKNYVFWHFI